MMHSRTIWITTALLAFLASNATAGLIGANINACWNTAYSSPVTTDTGQCDSGTAGFPNTSAVVVDPGVEFSINGLRDVDFTDNTVTITYKAFFGSPSPDLFIFTNLPGTITGLTLVGGDSLGITTAFTGTSIGLLIGSPECCTTFNTSTTFQVSFAEIAEIPEPSTVVLMGAGLLAAGLIRKRFGAA